jgi:hypothetical protein
VLCSYTRSEDPKILIVILSLSTYNKAPVIIPVDTPYFHCYKFHSKGFVALKKEEKKRRKKEATKSFSKSFKVSK